MLVTRGEYGKDNTWACDSCGKHYSLSKHKSWQGKRHFCSSNCQKEEYKKRDHKRVTDWVKKHGSASFKTGLGVTTDGYIWILVRNKGYFHNQVKLHRYLMEIKLGRRLTETEIVHHKNGNKFDNSIDNLEIVTRSEHNRIHKGGEHK